MVKKMNFIKKAGYGVGDFGCNLLSGAVGSFVTMYYTDSVMMGAAFIGTMMLMTRFLDGISDIIMGVIIDHTNTKYGKAKPWMIISAIPLVISVILLFNVPSGFSETAKKIYITLTYIFNSVICYTAVNTSYSTLCTLISPDPNERTSLSTIRMFFSTLATLIANSYTVGIMMYFGGGQKGFSAIAVIYSIVALVCITVTCLSCKEYSITPEIAATKTESSISNAAKIKIMFSTKYTFVLIVGFVFTWMSMVLGGSSTTYYTRDVLHNIGLMAPLTVAGTIPTLIALGSGLVPRLVVKHGKRNTILLGAVIQVIGSLIIVLAPENLTLITIGSIIKGFAAGFITSILFASTADVADYINLKHNVNMAGLTNSIVSFGMKVGVGFGSAAVGWMLAWGGYSAKLANSGMAQTAKTIFAEKLCYAGLPFIFSIIIVVCSIFLDVDKKVQTLRTTEC